MRLLPIAAVLAWGCAGPVASRVTLATAAAPTARAEALTRDMDSVVVTTRRIEIQRTRHDAVIIELPVVSGARADVVRAIAEQLTPEKLLFESLEDVHAEAARSSDDAFPSGLQSAGYHVLYNQHGLLEIDETTEYMAAYPSTNRAHVLVDLRTGTLVTVDRAFRPTSTPKMLARLHAMLDDEVAHAPGTKDPDFANLFENLDFTAKDLTDFSVSDAGVTFHYHYGFPHVAQALEPAGDFTLPWSAIASDVDPDGPLMRLANGHR
jgi:hypothetical protein